MHKIRWTMYILFFFSPLPFFSFFLIFFLLFFLCLFNVKLECEKYGEREHRFFERLSMMFVQVKLFFRVEAFPCEINCVPLGRSILREVIIRSFLWDRTCTSIRSTDCVVFISLRDT